MAERWMLGIRTEDWEAVCKEILPLHLFKRVMDETAKRAIKRNRSQNQTLHMTVLDPNPRDDWR